MQGRVSEARHLHPLMDIPRLQPGVGAGPSQPGPSRKRDAPDDTEELDDEVQARLKALKG